MAGYNGWGEGDTRYWNSESDYGNVHDTLASKFTRRNKDLCEKLNGTFYAGKTFKAGKRDTQAKCERKYCNLLGPEYEFPASDCLKLPGECSSWHCKGCEQDWSGDGNGKSL